MADFLIEDLAYAAGIIDGEGYIGITILEKSKSRPNRSATFTAVVNVGMADPEVVVWLHETFGGNVYSSEPGQYGNKSGVHQWRLTGENAAEFCQIVRPYLRLKHRQAQILIEYREEVSGRVPGPPRLTDEELQSRREFAANIRSLNQREKV